jgi:hypothetical protein
VAPGFEPGCDTCHGALGGGGACRDCTYARVAPRPRCSKPAPKGKLRAESRKLKAGKCVLFIFCLSAFCFPLVRAVRVARTASGARRRCSASLSYALLGVPCGYRPRSSRVAGERLAIRLRERCEGKRQRAKGKRNAAVLGFAFYLLPFALRLGCRTGTAPAASCFTGRRFAFRLPTPQVAGGAGFEPTQRASKARVLPLDDPPSWRRRRESNTHVSV